LGRVRRVWLIVLLVAAALLSALWIVLFPVWRFMYGYPVNLGEVSGHTDIVFPQGARLTRSWLQPAVAGDLLWAKVEMSREAANQFMKTALPGGKLAWHKGFRINAQFGAPEDLDPPDWQGWLWWRPDLVRNGIGAHVEKGPDGHVDLLIDGGGSGRATLYVFCWS